MPRTGRFLSSVVVACLAAAAPRVAGSANSPSLMSDPITKAVRRADCSKAVQDLRSEVKSNDSATALFIAGRMLDEGICVQKDPSSATAFFARSADLGDRSAAMDYAAKIGLGDQMLPGDLLLGVAGPASLSH